ncbi:hypothetical protein NDU88_002685 [Pleurodeles waltl]|uniref:Uncharacterized protein n=1 Tax=Pleurodeles waltl TaxID=8319 RepID=A0AAV7WM69_PLEWA|nr:hypothetical protein NDU88_002685 [Pleurodeles waltl]
MSPGRPGRFAQACFVDRASGDKERRKHGAAQGGEAAVAARRPQLRCGNNRFSVGRVRHIPPPHPHLFFHKFAHRMFLFPGQAGRPGRAFFRQGGDSPFTRSTVWQVQMLPDATGAAGVLANFGDGRYSTAIRLEPNLLRQEYGF